VTARYRPVVPIEFEEIRFYRHECAAVVAVMHQLDQVGDGGGWINFSPVLTEDEERRVPTRSGLGAWFSGRGPAMAMGTWTPRAMGPKPRNAQIGLAHGTGPNALSRLSELGIGLPSTWVKRQDHAKHGVVAELPDGVDEEQVIEWLITAATMLRTVVEPGNQWVAIIHRPV